MHFRSIPHALSGLGFIRTPITRIGLVGIVSLTAIFFAPSASGEVYGKLKEPCYCNGISYKAGDYIGVAYDGEGTWALSTSTLPYSHIDKSKVDLIDTIYFNPPLKGRLKQAATLYEAYPDLIKDHSTLEQPYRSSAIPFRNANEVSVISREGSDYIIVVKGGDTDIRARVSVSSIDITSGSTKSGTRTNVYPFTYEASQKPNLPQDTLNSNILPLIIGFGVTLALLMFFIKRKSRVISHASAFPHGFTPELRARFPAHTIYFVPDEVRALLNISPTDGDPAYRENCDGWWSRMLKMWIQPPRDDAERAEREAKFWGIYATAFTVLNSARQPVLKPKQEILDFFRCWEKWIFRDFYAATGVIHKTIVEDWVRHFVNAKEALALDRKKFPDGYKAKEVEKALNAQERFIREIAPAHYEKWGEWFFSHVQQALGLSGFSCMA
jgi:hypothetical protein